jgi:methylated-DNA-[protein]-cysteine S-methyltransferase
MSAEAGIYAREMGYLDSYVQIGVAQERVLSVEFPASPAPDADHEHELLDRVEAYLQGEPDEFEDVSVAMTMPTDQRKVLEAVRTVAYGEEVTVEQLAGMTPGLGPDEENTQRAVREALAANPAPVLIPTHRVRDGPGSAPADVEQKLRAVEGL